MKMTILIPKNAKAKIVGDLIEIQFENLDGISKLYERMEATLVKDDKELDRKDLTIYNERKIELRDLK